MLPSRAGPGCRWHLPSSVTEIFPWPRVRARLPLTRGTPPALSQPFPGERTNEARWQRPGSGWGRRAPPRFHPRAGDGPPPGRRSGRGEPAPSPPCPLPGPWPGPALPCPCPVPVLVPASVPVAVPVSVPIPFPAHTLPPSPVPVPVPVLAPARECPWHLCAPPCTTVHLLVSLCWRPWRPTSKIRK